MSPMIVLTSSSDKLVCMEDATEFWSSGCGMFSTWLLVRLPRLYVLCGGVVVLMEVMECEASFDFSECEMLVLNDFVAGL